MFTNRPLLPRSLNSTYPVTSANSVSSLPCATFSPGRCFVPRCRTMIVPAFTSCPPKRFTPSLCPCESRPFVDEPPPFLCAMTNSSQLNSLDLLPSQSQLLIPSLPASGRRNVELGLSPYFLISLPLNFV